MDFNRIPECYFEKLRSHIEIETIYSGNSTANNALHWLLEDPEPKRQCEDSNFMERYALVKMDFDTRDKECTLPSGNCDLFIARDEQCRWKSINCFEGKVVSILLYSTGLQGRIPSDIGLLSNLEEIRLGEQPNQVLQKSQCTLKSHHYFCCLYRSK